MQSSRQILGNLSLMDTLTDVRGHFALGRGQTSNSIQFSSVPWLVGFPKVHEKRFNRDSLPAFFLCEDIMSRSCIGRDAIGSLVLSIQHFLCRPRNTSPTLQFALKDGFGELSWRVTCPNMRVFVSWQLSEKTFVGPQGGWSCSALRGTDKQT